MFKPGTNNSIAAILFSAIIIVTVTSCRFYFDKTPDRMEITKDSSSLENGKNLAFNICAGCHYDPSVKKFVGKSLEDLPKIAGHLYSANLTNSTTHGIPPQYSDAELFYLLKTGIGKNGRFMPFMMRPMMADEDVNDIITYLRSGSGAVAAADTTIGQTRINVIGKIGLRVAASPQPYDKNVPRPSKDDPIAYGRYLVAVIGCYHCHSEKVLALNYHDPEKTKGFMSGGTKFMDPDGNALRAPNLTPDKETGIGSFTKNDFRKAVREGITPSGKKLSPPMDKYQHLTDQQVDAIYTYLQSLSVKHHLVTRRTTRKASI